jgi:hypothetical protein
MSNVQAVRSLMDEHMTPNAPLRMALDHLLREFTEQRAALNALTERVEGLERDREPV